MKLSVVITAAAAASPAFAEEEFCGQWDSTQTDDYIIYNNLWGQNNDKAGWPVKSFANAALKFDPVQLANVKSIPSAIEYDYKYDGNIITNMAYDLFTSATANGTVEYELMVWLAALGGAWPLTSTGKPIKEVKVGNVDFNLYQGKNGNTTVFSYVAVNTTESFSADFKQFFDKLPADNTIAPTQYLTHVQAGTEPFQGKNATLTVSKYSAAVNSA
ncbi:hypothetical protein JG688_00009648 [Phytophthora aleatoria]|uniref:Cell 12A endoglucanase n=1 Tax=Phytophthora aleatoria TaxID=2496075 RepID=A0A8J5M3W3_9STRA|nr:hypothetical protein JG688_00009648 [Phytophthora aleatoria]